MNIKQQFYLAWWQQPICCHHVQRLLPVEIPVSSHRGTGTEVNPESWTQLKGSNEKGI